MILATLVNVLRYSVMQCMYAVGHRIQCACELSKHDKLNPCWVNVGPPSSTLKQHWSNRVCREMTIVGGRPLMPWSHFTKGAVPGLFLAVPYGTPTGCRLLFHLAGVPGSARDTGIIVEGKHAGYPPVPPAGPGRKLWGPDLACSGHGRCSAGAFTMPGRDPCIISRGDTQLLNYEFINVQSINSSINQSNNLDYISFCKLCL